MLVLDTSILIEYQRSVPDAVQYVDDLVLNDAAVIHPVSGAELLEGVVNQKHQRETLEILMLFKRLTVKPSDLERCLLLMASLRLSHGVEWPDCLIASTCTRLGLPLVTLNEKHFRAIRGLKVLRPY